MISISNEKKWKFLSFALIGILGSGALATQAYAVSPTDTIIAILNDLKTKIINTNDKVNANLDATMSSRASQTSLNALQGSVDSLQTDVSGIKGKTDGLPSDPASDSNVDTRASQISLDNLQADVDALGVAVDDLPSGEGVMKAISLSKTFSPADGSFVRYTIIPQVSGKAYSGWISGEMQPGENVAAIQCLHHGRGNSLFSDSTGGILTPNFGFACEELTLFTLDSADGSDKGNAFYSLVIQYEESIDLTTQDGP